MKLQYSAMAAAIASGVLSLFPIGCAVPPTDNFTRADRDGDGKLSKSEVKKALTTAIYAKGDPDGDGKISYAEYSAVDPHYPKAKFDSRDLDKDGYVTQEELDRYAEKTRSFDALIAEFDANGDGHIDRAEADAFNARLLAAAGDNVLQKLYNLNAGIQGR